MRASFAPRPTFAVIFASALSILGVMGTASAAEKLTLSHEGLDRVMRAPPATPDALSDLPAPPAAPKPGAGAGTSIPPKFKAVTAGLSLSNPKGFAGPKPAKRSSLLSNVLKKAR